MRSIQGTAVTMGSVTPSLQEVLNRPYRRAGNPGWRDNDPSTWKTPITPARPGRSASEASHERHVRRLKEFQEIRAAEPDLPLTKIATRMGVSRRTVSTWVRELAGPAHVPAQTATKQQKKQLFAAAVAAGRDPSRPDVTAAARAARVSATTGYTYWQELRAEQATARQEAAS